MRNAENDYRKKYKILTRRYILSVFLLLILFIARQIIVMHLMSDEINKAAVMNVAGRQRMYSQKIIKEIMYIGNLDIDEVEIKSNYLEEIKEELGIWESDHRKLMYGNKDYDMDVLYDAIEPFFHNLYDEIEIVVKKIENNEDINNTINSSISILKANEKNFLESMEKILNQYEVDYKKSMEQVQNYHQFLFVIIMLVIIFMVISVFIPITKALRDAFWDVNETNDNIKEMFYHLKGAFFVINEKGIVVSMNSDGEEITGQNSILNDNLKINEIIQWKKIDISKIIDRINNGQRIDGIETDIEVINKDVHTVILSAFKVKQKKEDLIAISLFDITMQKKAEEALEKIAMKDELTGLYNRYFLDTIMNEEIERSERYEVPLAVVLLDLDNFKKINDTWGHPVGDTVLKLTADTLIKNLRISDYVIRIGGEEILMLMPNTSLNNATAVAEKLRKEIELLIHPVIGKYTASFGVAERRKGETYREIYKRVDEALYEAKETGRNKVCKSENMKEAYPSISLNWKDIWNSGESEIDKQHRGLLVEINEFINSSLNLENKESVLSFYNKILEHVIEHFQYEEKILKGNGYEDVDKHEEIHNFLIKKAVERKEAYYNNEIEGRKLVSFFLNEIIMGHLLTEDIKYFDAIKQN